MQSIILLSNFKINHFFYIIKNFNEIFVIRVGLNEVGKQTLGGTGMF